MKGKNPRHASRTSRACRACGRPITKKQRLTGLCARCRDQRVAVVAARLDELDKQKPRSP